MRKIKHRRPKPRARGGGLAQMVTAKKRLEAWGLSGVLGELSRAEALKFAEMLRRFDNLDADRARQLKRDPEALESHNAEMAAERARLSQQIKDRVRGRQLLKHRLAEACPHCKVPKHWGTGHHVCRTGPVLEEGRMRWGCPTCGSVEDSDIPEAGATRSVVYGGRYCVCGQPMKVAGVREVVTDGY